MKQTERIASELRHAMDGPAWHGESLMELLAGVTPDKAASKPLPMAHSIHEIVLHLNTWVRLASAALDGQAMPEWPFPEDWPPTTGTDWEHSLSDLKQATEELAARVGALTEQRLEDQVPGRTHTFGVLLLGIVQHAAYHGGQIALLRKHYPD